MALDLLDAPLRITWDLCPEDEAPLTEDELLLVAGRLVDAGIFFLTLEENPLQHPAIQKLLQCVAGGGCQVSLVLTDQVSDLSCLKELPGNPILFVDAGCWLDHSETGQERLESFLDKMVSQGLNPSLLWSPKHGELQSLTYLLALCRRFSLPRFKLPNHKIGANSDQINPAGYLQPEDLYALSVSIKNDPLDLTGTKLEVHDLFLWELLFPQGGGERSEYGGCQAGNSLGHIAANADLWPCSSWPLVLGNLLAEDLETLWANARRHEVRNEVSLEPSDCAGCRDYELCFGGCRGLALNLRRDGGRRDLLCPGPRKPA